MFTMVITSAGPPYSSHAGCYVREVVNVNSMGHLSDTGRHI